MSQSLPPSFGPPERVYVENEWYDGPRAGIADLNGQPHRFSSQWDEGEDEYTDTFLLWPVAEAELALEQEQWAIFVDWNERYEAGALDSASHPGHAGTNGRWDEIEAQLSSARKSVPSTTRLVKVQVVPLNQGNRYAMSGPDYQLAWALIQARYPARLMEAFRRGIKRAECRRWVERTSSTPSATDVHREQAGPLAARRF